MRSRLAVSLFIASALLAPAAFAQTEQPGLAIPPPTPESLVRVSLGDDVVRSGLADALKVQRYELPIAATVSPETAAGACPVGRSSLDEQLSVSPSRTCTAKSLTPELTEAVRKALAGN